MASRFFFYLSYWLGFTPWDTGVTPPEVIELIGKYPAGRMIDLGCGTGTNVIAFAEKGWEAEGVDFVPAAIRIARREASRRGISDQTIFHIGSVLSPEVYRGKYDLVLDIGCFHNFSGRDVERYIQLVSTSLTPGGRLLLYVHLLTDPEQGHGASEASLERIGEVLSLVERVDGDEGSRPSAWLEFVKEKNRS